MDLKHFHYVFIAMSILCTLGFGFWAMSADVRVVGSWGRVGGAASALMGILLIAYGVWFVRKSRQIIT
jgi:hypothetical protein